MLLECMEILYNGIKHKFVEKLWAQYYKNWKSLSISRDYEIYALKVHVCIIVNPSYYFLNLTP